MSIAADQHAFIQQAFACSAEVAAAVAARGTDRRHAVQEIILRPGDVGRETFLLMAGLAHALRYGRDGERAFLQEFEPGDIFGVVEQARPADQEAEVVALQPSRTAVFKALDFMALVEVHAAVALAVTRTLMRQLRTANEQMGDHIILSAKQRICNELLRQARRGDGHTIRPLPVLADLAVRVNSTRETTSRTISELERRGYLRREPDALVLTAPQRLEDLF